MPVTLTTNECWAAAGALWTSGDFISSAPLLASEFAGGTADPLPIVFLDHAGQDQLYLQADVSAALVVARFNDLVWLAPVSTQDNFADRGLFESLLSAEVPGLL